MKKTIMVALLLLATHLTYAQDSTALINKSWISYATNTSPHSSAFATRMPRYGVCNARLKGPRSSEGPQKK